MGRWRERVRQAPRETKDRHAGAHTHTHTNHSCWGIPSCPLQFSRDAVLCICVWAEDVLGVGSSPSSDKDQGAHGCVRSPWDGDGACWGAGLGICLEEGVTRTKTDNGQSRCTTGDTQGGFCLQVVCQEQKHFNFAIVHAQRLGPPLSGVCWEYAGCITDKKGGTCRPSALPAPQCRTSKRLVRSD